MMVGPVPELVSSLDVRFGKGPFVLDSVWSVRFVSTNVGSHCVNKQQEPRFAVPP